MSYVLHVHSFCIQLGYSPCIRRLLPYWVEDVWHDTYAVVHPGNLLSRMNPPGGTTDAAPAALFVTQPVVEHIHAPRVCVSPGCCAGGSLSGTAAPVVVLPLGCVAV